MRQGRLAVTDTLDQYDKELAEAFSDVLDAEDAIRAAKLALEEQVKHSQAVTRSAETKLAAAWKRIADFMEATGEFELTLPGTANDYRIRWQEGRKSVKADDLDAIPDEFIKFERKAKLKEIGDYLRQADESGKPPPNWARYETGQRKLVWKAVKKNGG